MQLQQRLLNRLKLVDSNFLYHVSSDEKGAFSPYRDDEGSPGNINTPFAASIHPVPDPYSLASSNLKAPSRRRLQSNIDCSPYTLYLPPFSVCLSISSIHYSSFRSGCNTMEYSRSVPFSALLYFTQLATSPAHTESYLQALVVTQSSEISSRLGQIKFSSSRSGKRNTVSSLPILCHPISELVRTR